MGQVSILTCFRGYKRKLLPIEGDIAKRLGRGLQNLLDRFNSDCRLQHPHRYLVQVQPAWMAELVDAQDLKSCARKGVPVRSRVQVPRTNIGFKARSVFLKILVFRCFFSLGTHWGHVVTSLGSSVRAHFFLGVG